MNKQIYIVKATGEREEFDPAKLKASLLRAKAGSEIAENITAKIEGELKEGMTTAEIYHNAFGLLAEAERGVAARYSLRKAILDLGPTGFPFEQFVAEIFRAKGFETTTEFIARGQCAEHEIDVTAWNENKLIFIESKFHNEHGTKSDLKTALYVKARWDDLADREFDLSRLDSISQSTIGQRKLHKVKKMDEGWLITNTKFSSSAIEYAKCRNMKLVG